MPFLIPNEKPVFPSPLLADADGLLAVGGQVTADFLEAAYKKGIFPWFSEGDPPLWWSPDPRPVFFPGEIKVSKSMRQWIRKHADYRITINRSFEEVLHYCATVDGRDLEGTWLSDSLKQGITELFRRGLAISVEVRNVKGELRGGLYGILAGKNRRVFSGESMFSLEPDTSKYALIYLVNNARKMGYNLIDGQVVSGHLLWMGARLLARETFIKQFIYL